MRLFVAVFPTPEVAARLSGVTSRLRERAPELRWASPETLHFTLAFLGGITEAGKAKAGAALRRACRAASPFRVELGGAGAFSTWERPSVIWVGLKEGGEPMARLAQAVRAELGLEGLAFDPKPFVPHLTLGRRRGRPPLGLRESVESALREAELGSMTADCAQLVSSESSARGPIYSSLLREPLEGA